MISSPELVTTERKIAACIHLLIPGNEMPRHIDPAISEILQVLQGEGKTPIGPMFSYHKRQPSDSFDFDLGFPVAEPIMPRGRVVNGELPPAKVVRAVYQGPYDHLAQAWGELRDWVRSEGLGETGRFWECYLTNPEQEPDPSKWLTELNWVVG